MTQRGGIAVYLGIPIPMTTTNNVTGVLLNLSPLANNGRNIQTHSPSLGNLVINVIHSGANSCIPGSTIDQTGKNRPIQSGRKMDAFEIPVCYLPLVLR